MPIIDKIGSMFSTLKRVTTENWYSNNENLTINLYTPSALMQYQVFSVYESKAESYYCISSFASNESFLSFLKDLKSRSIHDFNVDLSSDDQILTLSTCSDNNAYRTVLHAKKITL